MKPINLSDKKQVLHSESTNPEGETLEPKQDEERQKEILEKKQQI